MAGEVGRPPKWQTPQALQAEIDAYFESTPEEEWTITGLALALNTYRDVLMDYQEKDEFSNTVKRAKLKVQYAYEKDLRKKGRSGDIFALKNFGWTDKQEFDHKNDGGKFEGGVMTPTMAAASAAANKVFEEKMRESLLE